MFFFIKFPPLEVVKTRTRDGPVRPEPGHVPPPVREGHPESGAGLRPAREEEEGLLAAAVAAAAARRVLDGRGLGGGGPAEGRVVSVCARRRRWTER